MTREVIKDGMKCPLCGSSGTAVAKLDAKGRPYLYGAHCCNAQLFARNDDQARKMAAAHGLNLGGAQSVQAEQKRGSGLLIG